MLFCMICVAQRGPTQDAASVLKHAESIQPSREREPAARARVSALCGFSDHNVQDAVGSSTGEGHRYLVTRRD